MGEYLSRIISKFYQILCAIMSTKRPTLRLKSQRIDSSKLFPGLSRRWKLNVFCEYCGKSFLCSKTKLSLCHNSRSTSLQALLKLVFLNSRKVAKNFRKTTFFCQTRQPKKYLKFRNLISLVICDTFKADLGLISKNLISVKLNV